MPAASTLLQHFSTTAAPRIAIFISSRVLLALRAFACARCRMYAAVTIVSYRKCDAAATNAVFVSILLSCRLSHPANADTLNSTSHVACGSSNLCPRSRFTAHVRSRPTTSSCHNASVFARWSFVSLQIVTFCACLRCIACNTTDECQRDLLPPAVVKFMAEKVNKHEPSNTGKSWRPCSTTTSPRFG